jgi:hypothetical protein
MLFGGRFPAMSIADARQWASALNGQVDAGIDPREAQREEIARATMTVAKAHDLYMQAVRAGRTSRAKRKNKPRTIKDKLEIYHRDIAPKLGPARTEIGIAGQVAGQREAWDHDWVMFKQLTGIAPRRRSIGTSGP